MYVDLYSLGSKMTHEMPESRTPGISDTVSINLRTGTDLSLEFNTG